MELLNFRPIIFYEIFDAFIPKSAIIKLKFKKIGPVSFGQGGSTCWTESVSREQQFF